MTASTAADRLRAWATDPRIDGSSVRSYEPYANPAELRRDVLVLLDELDAAKAERNTWRAGWVHVLETWDLSESQKDRLRALLADSARPAGSGSEATNE